jgi:hypothetical protein
MRDTLLDGHLAEELASKVALAFDRIRNITADGEARHVSAFTSSNSAVELFVDGTRNKTEEHDLPIRP